MQILKDDFAGISGEELYRRFLDGDECSFEALVTLYRESLTRYIYSFIKDMRDAEEIMIDAFAELAASKKYRGQSSIKTYLFSIGRHLAIRHARKFGNKNTVPFDSIDFDPDEITPEAGYLRAEQDGSVQTAMHSLKPDYHEVLRLVYFKNMSYADVGQTMRKTKKQVENLVYRARASLKKKLADKGEFL